MDTLQAMRTLVRVIERGSFSAVARELNVSQPTVSKQIQWLEQHLGGTLLARSTRQLAPTQEGWHYYEQCRAILQSIDGLEHRFREGRDALAGVLRVAAPAAFGRLELVPGIAGFLEEHPGLQIELVLSDDIHDLRREGIDVAFRCGAIKQPGVVARRMGEIPCQLFASAAYLQKAGVPVSPTELSQHRCIGYQSESLARPAWLLRKGEQWFTVPVGGPLRCNSSDGLRSAVLADIGISFAQPWLFRSELESGRVLAVLPDYHLPAMPVHAVYLPDRRGQRRVRALVRHMQQFWQSTRLFAPEP
ncbi:LysR family transcriptional regulator [Paludibacterium yongneupense]|nr:LysR family transcriptional regulator [Paludibacterium yongneupense]